MQCTYERKCRGCGGHHMVGDLAPMCEKAGMESIGEELLRPSASKWWSKCHVEQHPNGDWYLLIPGNGFVLHLRMDEIGHIDGFLDDTSGG